MKFKIITLLVSSIFAIQSYLSVPINNSANISQIDTNEAPEIVKINQSYFIDGVEIKDSSELINNNQTSVSLTTTASVSNWNMVSKNLDTGTLDFFYFDQDHYSGNTITECTANILVNAVTNDFNSYSSYMNTTYKFEPIGKYEKCPEGTYKVALVCYKTGRWIFTSQDYHWYRQDADGYWSHKQGTTEVKRIDNSGMLITDPETCDRGNYTNFVGYFAVTPWSNLYVQ